MDDDLTGQFSTSESYEEDAKLGVVSIARVKSETARNPLATQSAWGTKVKCGPDRNAKREEVDYLLCTISYENDLIFDFGCCPFHQGVFGVTTLVNSL
jgi:hypothetical protein